MDIYYRMGMLYGGQDQTAQARSSFQAAVALSPTSVESLFALGICMSLENDWFEAERHIRRVLRLRPGHESARFDLAVALQQLKRPQEALNSYDGCLTTYTSSAVERHEAWANRAGVLVDLGRVVEAISSYGKALVIAPRFPAVYANLAVVYNGRQRQAGALEALRVAQKLAPTFSPSHLNLGLTLKQPVSTLRRLTRSLTPCDWHRNLTSRCATWPFLISASAHGRGGKCFFGTLVTCGAQATVGKLGTHCTAWRSHFVLL